MRGEQHAELQRKSENLEAQIQQMGVQVAMKEEFVRNVTKNYADFTRFQATGIGNVMATLELSSRTGCAPRTSSKR